MELRQFEVRRPEELAAAFSAVASEHMEGVVVVDDAMLTPKARSIVELAIAQQLPSVGSVEVAEAGGLMAYGVDFVEMFRHVAVFVDKILRGARPDGLPVEQPTKFKFLINLKTAKALGRTIPKLLLARADEVVGSDPR